MEKKSLRKSDDLQIKHISEGHSYSPLCPLYILFAFLKHKMLICFLNLLLTGTWGDLSKIKIKN